MNKILQNFCQFFAIAVFSPSPGSAIRPSGHLLGFEVRYENKSAEHLFQERQKKKKKKKKKHNN